MSNFSKHPADCDPGTYCTVISSHHTLTHKRLSPDRRTNVYQVDQGREEELYRISRVSTRNHQMMAYLLALGTIHVCHVVRHGEGSYSVGHSLKTVPERLTAEAINADIWLWHALFNDDEHMPYDFPPRNMLLDEDGHYLLFDFHKAEITSDLSALADLLANPVQTVLEETISIDWNRVSKQLGFLEDQYRSGEGGEFFRAVLEYAYQEKNNHLYEVMHKIFMVRIRLLKTFIANKFSQFANIELDTTRIACKLLQIISKLPVSALEP